MEKVLYEKRDRIAYITLNRPDAKNAIDSETNELLWGAWMDFDADEAVDVAILTGTGDAFCAGADLKTFIPEWKGADALKVRENIPWGLGGITRGLHRIYKPIDDQLKLEAINGYSCSANPEIEKRLEDFYKKEDAGRVGKT